jgi:hypothetical protein
MDLLKSVQSNGSIKKCPIQWIYYKVPNSTDLLKSAQSNGSIKKCPIKWILCVIGNIKKERRNLILLLQLFNSTRDM